jgi:phosphoribosylaminoimidazole-succinocarboxamide synthase
MIPIETIQAQLGKTLDRTSFHELGNKYEGKVRDCYTLDGRRTIVVSDRISAFDVVLGTIPFKGQVLNRMAAFWFEATANLAPNHVVNVPDPNVMVARECKPPPLSDEVRIEAARRYIQVCELVTGRPFEPDTEEPNARIRRNLGI